MNAANGSLPDTALVRPKASPSKRAVLNAGGSEAALTAIEANGSLESVSKLAGKLWETADSTRAVEAKRLLPTASEVAAKPADIVAEPNKSAAGGASNETSKPLDVVGAITDPKKLAAGEGSKVVSNPDELLGAAANSKELAASNPEAAADVTE